jgi:hypothetical protein
MVTNSSKIVSLADGDLSPAFISRVSPIRRREAGENHLPDHAV